MNGQMKLRPYSYSSSAGACNSAESTPLIVRTPLVRTAKRGFLLTVTLFSALGGFLFGYDTGVVSGAMLKIRETFGLSPTWVELIVSATIASAAISALVAGVLCDVIGRKPTLITASAVFTAGAVVMGTAPYPWVLLIGRVVVGAGIGLAAAVVPMYIAELAPAHVRGRLVVVNVAFITGGQFVATLVDGAFSYLKVDMGWRFMLGLGGVPSLVMFVGLLLLPESPRWLVFHGEVEKARLVLNRVRHCDDVIPELQGIILDHEEYTKSRVGAAQMARKFCTSRPVLLALMVGCGLQLFQQFGGINTVMYYGAIVLQMAGFSDRDAIWLAAVPAGTNFLFTLVGLFLVEQVGRRRLLIGSMCGVILSLLLLSLTFLLMDHFSLPATPLDPQCAYHRCGSCVANSGCGFCVGWDQVKREYVSGTCSVAKSQPNGTTVSGSLVNGSCKLIGQRKALVLNFDLELDMLESGSGMGPVAPTSTGTIQHRWFPFQCPGNHLAPLAIVALILYLVTFAPGFGPLPWTVNSEIYPTWARSTAISIATTFNWAFNLLVSMSFLTLADLLGQPATFGLYAGLTLVGLVFVLLFLPETRKRSLEEVESLFQRPYFMNWCQRQY